MRVLIILAILVAQACQNPLANYEFTPARYQEVSCARPNFDAMRNSVRHFASRNQITIRENMVGPLILLISDRYHFVIDQPEDRVQVAQYMKKGIDTDEADAQTFQELLTELNECP